MPQQPAAPERGVLRVADAGKARRLLQAAFGPAGIVSASEVEPALTALLFAAAVPSQTQALDTPAGHLDQVLLQRIPADGVTDAVIVQLAIWTVGANKETVVLAIQTGCYAMGGEFHISEVAEYRFIRRLGRGQIMVGTAPCRTGFSRQSPLSSSSR